MDIRDLVAQEETYDPLETLEVDSEDLSSEQDEQPLVGAPLEVVSPEEALAEDTRPPDVRIRELLGNMPGQRRVLLNIVDFCRYAKTGEEIDEFTVALQENAYSVYSPAILRELLEKAGALAYLVDEEECSDAEVTDAADAAEFPVAEAESTEGDDLSASSDAELVCATDVKSEAYDDGEDEVCVEYREIGEAKPGVWLATDEGLLIVDSQDDEKATWNLLDQNPRYLNIYQRVIDYCTEDGGRSIKELDRLVNDDPLLQEPRRYSGYFIARLEKSGAIEWRNGWRTTSLGKKVLEALANNVSKTVIQATLS